MDLLRRGKSYLSSQPGDYARLAIASMIIGFLSAVVSDSLKKAAGHYEEYFLVMAKASPVLFILLPAAGFSMIYFLRQSPLMKENKGIGEISEALKTSHWWMPARLVPSHYINGLLTVASGGSTGVDVPAVVASATIGSISGRRLATHRSYKTELICAGVAAGITALFSSPIAGILFSLEVLTKKVSKAFVLCSVIAVSAAWLFNRVLDEGPLFNFHVSTWHTGAIPYFILLGVIAALNSAYLTKSVFFFKKQFAKFRNSYVRTVTGAAVISAMLLLFPQLYGDGYHAVKALFLQPASFVASVPLLLTLAGVILLKPIITSVTLASGGDGGVLAPSIFIGAFLGLMVAIILNTFFNAGVIPVNFMIVGMAAVLSSSIHAPFTAVFLVCGLIGSYALIIPIFIGCAISKLTSMMVFPYTVYSPPAVKG